MVRLPSHRKTKMFGSTQNIPKMKHFCYLPFEKIFAVLSEDQNVCLYSRCPTIPSSSFCHRNMVRRRERSTNSQSGFGFSAIWQQACFFALCLLKAVFMVCHRDCCNRVRKMTIVFFRKRTLKGHHQLIFRTACGNKRRCKEWMQSSPGPFLSLFIIFCADWVNYIQ